MAKRGAKSKEVESLTHDESARLNIPTAEYQTQSSDEAVAAIQVAYKRLNRDLDPQLVWRGKDVADWADLEVSAPPLYIQEKVHPKALVEDLQRLSRQRSVEQAASEAGFQIELFSDFNGLPAGDARTEFYQHQMNWSNRMILGDSLQVMASLAEREGIRGQVQCIYIDPPYGIKFNSNFQWSTTSRDVKDGNAGHITREPEQVRAFRDTWRDGVHSYLTYLRDRLTASRDLLTATGSIFVQIGDENVHRVRALLDEVFGTEAFVAQVTFRVKSPLGNSELARTSNYILWYAKNPDSVKFRELRALKQLAGHSEFSLVQQCDGQVVSRVKLDPAEITDSDRYLTAQNLGSSGYTESCMFDYSIEGRTFSHPRGKSWKTNESGMRRLARANRLHPLIRSLRWRYYLDDAPGEAITDVWQDTFAAHDKTYVVQTATSVIERCLLMTTDPGDLVLDPTCGSGTTAYVAEQWGRRWITIDTSRVALTLARARLMGARYPYYLLSDSPEGQQKEADLSHVEPSDAPTYGDVRQGFVYERVPHITLRSIANNAEIDVIYEQRQPVVETALADLNSALRADPPEPFDVSVGGRKGERIDFTQPLKATVPLPSGEEAPASGLLEWEVPRERPGNWPAEAAEPHDRFWQARLERQQAIDESIAAKADFEFLYDKPYEDSSKVRVAGPFTVESISPHRYLALDADDQLIDPVAEARSNGEAPQDFVSLILDNLRAAGVQQVHKAGRINFVSLQPWPGEYVCAEGAYLESAALPANGRDGAEPVATATSSAVAAPDAGSSTPDGAGSPEQDAPASAATRRAAIFVGPEFGTVTRPDLVAASREAAEAGFDVLIACAFNYDAHASEFTKSGPLQVLQARMNADLHMASELKSTGSGNLFVIFGEPDIELLTAHPTSDGAEQFCVKLRGIDVFDPTTGDIRSDEPDSIACWFVDTNYDHESFFVRHAYFLGADDPYRSLKTTLKAEIDEDAWSSLRSDLSRPFPAPETGHVAVKVINHLGDEVMKVFRVPNPT